MLVCISLISITFPYGLKSIEGWAFAGCSSLLSVSIPNSVENIGIRAFANCTSLTSMSIPNSVIYIEKGLLHGCSSLSSVTIPDNINIIEYEAFAECFGLKEVHCNNSTPPVCRIDAFKGINVNDCKLYVPTGSKSAYKSAEVWCDFKSENIIEENITSLPLVEMTSEPRMIYNADGIIGVSGITNGTEVSVYTTNGRMVDSAISSGNSVSFNASQLRNTTAIVKICDKVFKVLVK